MNTSRAYHTWVGGELYEVHPFAIPSTLSKYISFIKKWFKVLGRAEIPKEHQRRKSYLEYGDVALMILYRMDTIIDVGNVVVAGSQFLCTIPWALIGESKSWFAKNTFPRFNDICNHYEDLFFNCATTDVYMYLRFGTNALRHLEEKYNKPPDYIMSVAIALLADLLCSCGPDCEQVYDLFTNDFRDTPEYMDLDDWEELRCKVMGRSGKIKKNDEPVVLGRPIKDDFRPTKKFVPRVCEPELEEVPCNGNLAIGEKTKVATWVSYGIEDFNDCECEDAYESRADVKERMKKYPKLLRSTNSVDEFVCGSPGFYGLA